MNGEGEITESWINISAYLSSINHGIKAKPPDLNFCHVCVMFVPLLRNRENGEDRKYCSFSNWKDASGEKGVF